MSRILIATVVFNLVILISGCSSTPPKPVLPDGLHRVPVNRDAPVPASSVSSVPAATSAVGAGS